MATALAIAMRAKGVDPNEVQFEIDLARYLNNGGTVARARAIIDAVDEKGSGGLQTSASNGRLECADASRPNDGEAGQPRGAAYAAEVPLPASPSPQAGRDEGHRSNADKATGAAHSSSPRRLPGHAKRGLTAIASIQGTLAASLFDSIRLPDGRALRNVRWSECVPLASKYRKLSRILLAVHNYAMPAEASTTLDAIVNEEQLAEIVASVEKINDII